ncbi:VOC family protein [Candidatus Woesearchaeota archaeon]|nr:VOC family protein [Candidatus Woesearchaeota archaeon]
MIKIEPYLIFDGNCEEAFNFYKEVFGNEFLTISKFKDAPQEGMELNEEDKKRIMHVSLPIGNETMLMGSDTPKQTEGTTFGDNISLSIQANSENEATNIFNRLSDGGRIKMQLAKTFWNAYFGMCIDKFGIHWMINYSYE